MFCLKTSNLTISFIYLGTKVYTKDRGETKFYSCLFLLPFKKTEFFVIALVSVEKLASVEDAPSASLREGR